MTGPPALRPQSALQRRLRAAFTVRLGLKATAVFIAVVLWFVINAKEPQLQLVPVRFTPVLDSSLVQRIEPRVVQRESPNLRMEFGAAQTKLNKRFVDECRQ